VKTISLKKVSVIAVASLGFGLMSVVPAQAAGNDRMWCDVADGLTNGTQTTAANDACNGVAGVANTVQIQYDDVVADSRITVSGAAATLTNSSGAQLVLATNGLSGSFSATTGNNDGTVLVTTPTVGTVSVNIYAPAAAGIYSSTPTETVTITVNASAISGTISATTSTATMTAAGTGVLSTDAKSISGFKDANVSIGSIAVALATVAGSIKATNVTSLSITGPGLLTVTGGTTNATGRSIVEVGADGTFAVSIIGDGSTGPSTITITTGAFTATRTVTWFGTAAKLVATQALSYASTAGADLGGITSTTGAVTVLITDATGFAVSGVTPVAVSDATSVIASGACSASSSTGKSYCKVTSAAASAGKTANVTFKTTVSSVDIVSNASKFTLGGAVSKYSIAFDKTTYAPGSKMTLNITALDSTGAVPFDQTADLFTSVTPSAASSYVSTTDIAGIDLLSGKGSIVFFAPLTGGPVSALVGVEAALATAVGASSLTASATISDPNSVLMTQIDALNAKIVALNALIAKIMKKLGVK
jgi:hypothetical protein